MRNWMRLLMMFGPMILQQIQRSQRKKRQNDQWESPRNNQPRSERRERERPTKRPEPQVVDLKPKKSPEEQLMDLKEKDIMLTEEDMRYAKAESTLSIEHDNLLDEDSINPN